ncbi:precorrin-4 C(11)-methyltransferase [Desulfuromonas carbonis]|uniref:SAM-dependent methyltransferase n=1 Tax=Desulfuromonas sp. DDH964 TaxID=1823759 RepID=UPI00078DB74D|nr:SAM-dependent methyltransferase [Desulfuromonas sp. DDH964]AMV72159.1 cobalt-precorrin-4 C11-methyltransferase [Desulfuromonas sp. DDH964]
MNKVYFIGAGPGDPELLTLRGANLLKGCATVFAIDAFAETFAGLVAGKELRDPFDYPFAELIALLQALAEKAPVAFLVPGDLTFYSPFQALVDGLGDQAEVIPGVGTANAASAALKKTLDLPSICNRTILVSPRTLGDGPDAPTLEALAAPGVTLLIYMNNLPLDELCAQLRRGYGGNVPIALLHRLGLAGETVLVGALDDIAAQVGERDFFNLSGPSRRPALTLVVAGETLASQVDGSWWDFRRDHIWRPGGEA